MGRLMLGPSLPDVALPVEEIGDRGALEACRAGQRDAREERRHGHADPRVVGGEVRARPPPRRAAAPAGAEGSPAGTRGGRALAESVVGGETKRAGRLADQRRQRVLHLLARTACTPSKSARSVASSERLAHHVEFARQTGAQTLLRDVERILPGMNGPVDHVDLRVERADVVIRERHVGRHAQLHVLKIGLRRSALPRARLRCCGARARRGPAPS